MLFHSERTTVTLFCRIFSVPYLFDPAHEYLFRYFYSFKKSNNREKNYKKAQGDIKERTQRYIEHTHSSQQYAHM